MRLITIISLILVNVFLIYLSCSEGNKSTEEKTPFSSALPHSEALPGSNLSREDEVKLAQAKGIIATPLKVEDLVDQINNGSKGLNLYCLWRLNCPECDKLLNSLSLLRQNIEENVLAIHHINTNLSDELPKVNAHIRKLGLINNNYILSGVEDYKLGLPYSKLFKTSAPVLIIVNNTEGIKFTYERAFSFEELYALIQPLTIN